MGNTTEAMLEQAVRLIGDTLNEIGHAVDVEKAAGRFKGEVLLGVFKGIRASHSGEYTGMACFFVGKGISVSLKGSRVREIGSPVPHSSLSLPKRYFSFIER